MSDNFGRIPNQRWGDTAWFRGSQWDRVPAGTSGQFYKSQGAVQAPLWANLTPADITALFDSVAPTTIAPSDVAGSGAVAIAARRDHRHGAPATYPATAHNILSATHGDTVAASPTRGAIIVGNSTPAAAWVARGATGQVPRSNGTDTVMANPRNEDLTTLYRARVTRSAGQGVGSGAFAAITWNTVDYDDNSNMSSGVYTVPVNGRYLITAAADFATIADAQGVIYVISIFVNGTRISDGNRFDIQTGGLTNGHALVVTDILNLAATATVDIRVFQNSGGSRTFVTTAQAGHFSIHLVST